MSRKMTEEEREKFLAEPHVAILSVTSEDGIRPPLTVPVWYDYTPGGNIIVSTGVDLRKTRLIRAAGRLAISVQQEALPYRYVTVEGTVVNTVEPVPHDRKLALTRRYLSAAAAVEFAGPGVDGFHPESVLFEIRPDKWITADYG